MTDEEKNAMIQFFGTMHAHAKQTDQQIVGQSQFLRPISSSVKQELENVLASNMPQFAPPPQYAPQPEMHQVHPQYIPPPVALPPPPPPPQDPQLEFNFSEPKISGDPQVVPLLKSIDTSLKTIIELIQNANVEKKPKSRKVQLI